MRIVIVVGLLPRHAQRAGALPTVLRRHSRRPSRSSRSKRTLHLQAGQQRRGRCGAAARRAWCASATDVFASGLETLPDGQAAEQLPLDAVPAAAPTAGSCCRPTRRAGRASRARWSPWPTAGCCCRPIPRW